ncbi:MAG TPA: hypothetical protein VGH20_02855 [Myxococcales bacterium]
MGHGDRRAGSPDGLAGGSTRLDQSAGESASIDPHETLFNTARKRFVPVYGPNEAGVRELVLHVGVKEIRFDEPELFPWAEKLIEQDSFMAGAATTWLEAPLEWPRVQGMLEVLVEEGILARSKPEHVGFEAKDSAWHRKFLAYDERRPVVDGPRFWNPDAGAVLREVCGRDVPTGYIESVVGVHRMAHVALDREGRQVGEMNSFPDVLRLRLPVEWKTCGYAGSRFRSEMPMNMTALRSMLAHWKPVLRAVALFREEFLSRYPQLPDGRWKLGELHFAATGILALVGLQLTRWNDPVRDGDLDAVLSSLFRVVDGVRMISAHLLDLFERPMFHDTPITPREVAGAAESEDQYRSGRGVCAGPQAMIDELIETLMNGKREGGAAADGPPEAWLADIPKGLDYGLLGCQLQAVVFTIWVRMGLALTRIHEALERSPELTQGRVGQFRELMHVAWSRLQQGRNHLAEQRDFSEPYYRRMFNNAQRGIRGRVGGPGKDLGVELTPPESLLGEDAAGTLGDLFVRAEEPAFAATHAPLLRQISRHVLDYLRYERNALRTAEAVQRQINALLERPQPDLPLRGSHLATYFALNRIGGLRGQLYLPEVVQESLGLVIENDQHATTVFHAGGLAALD